MNSIQKTKTKLNMTGLLLAGGQSSRMGQNKAFLKIEDKTIIARNLEVLAGTFAEVLISANEKEIYNKYGYKVIGDVLPGRGPLAGIYSGLQAASYDYVFATACDMPFLKESIIRKMAGETKGWDIIMPYASGKHHPLHAFYHKKIAPFALSQLNQGKLRVMDLAGACKTKVIDFEKDGDNTPFINVNTPGEWEKILKLTGGYTRNVD